MLPQPLLLQVLLPLPLSLYQALFLRLPQSSITHSLEGATEKGDGAFGVCVVAPWPEEWWERLVSTQEEGYGTHSLEKQ
jgi:hypothetical protein